MVVLLRDLSQTESHPLCTGVLSLAGLEVHTDWEGTGPKSLSQHAVVSSSCKQL